MNITPEKAHLDAFLSGDGTAGHSKGNWRPVATQIMDTERSAIALINTRTIPATDDPEFNGNRHIIALAQHAPHDCGDPECPGVVNKRKLELYDKFQVAINEFAKAGLLT